MASTGSATAVQQFRGRCCSFVPEGSNSAQTDTILLGGIQFGHSRPSFPKPGVAGSRPAGRTALTEGFRPSTFPARYGSQGQRLSGTSPALSKIGSSRVAGQDLREQGGRPCGGGLKGEASSEIRDTCVGCSCGADAWPAAVEAAAPPHPQVRRLSRRPSPLATRCRASHRGAARTGRGRRVVSKSRQPSKTTRRPPSSWRYAWSDDNMGGVFAILIEPWRVAWSAPHGVGPRAFTFRLQVTENYQDNGAPRIAAGERRDAAGSLQRLAPRDHAHRHPLHHRAVFGATPSRRTRPCRTSRTVVQARKGARVILPETARPFRFCRRLLEPGRGTQQRPHAGHRDRHLRVPRHSQQRAERRPHSRRFRASAR